jgi:type IV secretory pathway VirB10-like protein
MLKKTYPKIIKMRKSIIGVAIGGILLIVMLILFNMYYAVHQQKTAKLQTLAKSKAILSNNSEIYWYKNQAIPKSVVLSKSEITDPQITSIEDPVYKKAKVAPISANQISVNLVSPITEGLSNEKPSSSNDHQPVIKHYLSETLQNPISSYEIKAGTIIPGILITGINSELPGQIIGQVRANIYDTVSGKYLLIPQGAKITGLYDSQIIHGQKRVLVVWKRIIFPNGKSLDLESMPGVDLSGYAGFHDQVNNHYAKIWGSVVLLSVLSAGAELIQPQRQLLDDQSSINQVLAESFGVNIENLATSMAMKNFNLQPTLEIRPGYLFNIGVTKDIILSSSYEA